ncbi:MAG: reverse transcriptase-like protein [Bacteroidales bacterium]|nr:reverse transcriptase-like protein [Bacteroidales bacterium]
MHRLRLFTDGSANSQYGAGAWAACVISAGGKRMLSGTAWSVTHHAMELQAVIEGLLYIQTHEKNVCQVEVYSDSQYVVDLPDRRARLEAAGYLTQKGKPVQNRDRIRKLFELMDRLPVVFTRVASHSKAGRSEITDYNREVDKLSRELLRGMIRGG